MTRTVFSVLTGFMVGLIVMGTFMYKAAPGLMLIENESMYDFEESVDRFTESVQKEDWKLPKVHDLQKSMASFGKTVRPVKVFELCHPDHADRILREGDERIVSSLMPCRVAIYEKDDGKTYISRMNSGLMAKTMGGLVAEVMADASRENEEILEAIVK